MKPTFAILAVLIGFLIFSKNNFNLSLIKLKGSDDYQDTSMKKKKMKTKQKIKKSRYDRPDKFILHSMSLPESYLSTHVFFTSSIDDQIKIEVFFDNSWQMVMLSSDNDEDLPCSSGCKCRVYTKNNFTGFILNPHKYYRAFVNSSTGKNDLVEVPLPKL